MKITSYIYQRTGYPVGELVQLATLRARDSKQTVRVQLQDGSHIDIEPPEDMA